MRSYPNVEIGLLYRRLPWSPLRSPGSDPLASMAGPAFPRRAAGSGLPTTRLARGTRNPGPWSAGVLVASIAGQDFTSWLALM